MTPIGIQLTLNGQKEVSSGLQQVGKDMERLGGSGQQLGNLSQGMGAAARTAGQLQQATQQLPMQFQDIVVSLQAGQQPLTVFLQQGSQLAGSFGSAGAAAKAMLGYVVGLINPVSVLAAGVAAVGVAYYQGSKEQDAWIKGIVTTGNASGVTTSQLREYARQIDAVVGTQQQAAAGLADFVQAGVRGGDELRRYTEAAVMWEKATGQAVSTTAKQFADLQNAPLQAVIKLNEGTNFLTTSVYEQVKALEAQGDKVGAAQVAMDALEGSMRERSKEIADSLGYLERGWNAIANAAKEGWDAMLGVGRAATTEDKLSRVQNELAGLRSQSTVGFANTAGGAAIGRPDRVSARIVFLEQEEKQLLAIAEAEKQNAAAKAESARQTNALIAFDGKYSKALEGEVSLQQKLSTARAEAVAAGKSEADIQKVLAYVTEEHNKSLQKGGSTAKQAQTSYQTLLSTINQKIVAMQSEAKAGDQLTEAEKLRARYQEDLNTKGRQYTAQQRERVEAALQVLAAEEQQAIASRELAKAHEDDAKALERLTQQRERSVQSLEDSVQKARDEEQAAAMAAASNISNAQALAQVAVARAEDAYQQAVANGEAPKTLDFLEREMQARRQLVELMGQRGVREANEKAQEQLTKSWERTSQTIGNTLSDYIMGGGKDAATYLKRLFSTLVLQPVVNWGVQGMLGMLGMGGGTGGGLGGVMNLFNTGKSAYGLIGGGMSAANSFGTGLANLTGTGLDGLLASNGAYGTAGGVAGSAGSALSSVMNFAPWLALIAAGMNMSGKAFDQGYWLDSHADWLKGWSATGGIAPLSLSLDTSLLEKLGLSSKIANMITGGSLWAKAFDKLGITTRGGNHSGGTYNTLGWDTEKTVLSGTKWGVDDYTDRGNEDISKALETSIGALMDIYNGFAQEFGNGSARELDIAAGFAANPRYKDEDAFAFFSLFDKVTGELLATLDQREGGLGSDVDVAWSSYLGDIAGALVDQLKDAGLPKWMSDIFDGLGEDISIEGFQAAIAQIAIIDAQFESLGRNMSAFADLSGDAQTALLAAAGGMEALLSTADVYYSSMYSDEERMKAAGDQLNQMLAKWGIFADRGGIDVFDGDEAKAKLRQAVEELMSSGNAELAYRLMEISGSFASVADYAAAAAEAAADAAKRAAEEAQQKQLDAAWANYEAAVNRERELLQARMGDLQQSISTLSSMQNTLKAGADALYSNVDSTNQARAVEGMLYIESALAAARQGADMTSFTGLSDAVTATRQGLAAGKYTSQFEKERDQLVWAGQFAELGDLAGEQLSVDERQLKALTDQLDAYDRQLKATRDLIDGVDLLIDKTLSPEAAYDILMRVFKGESAEPNKPAGGGSSGNGSAAGGGASWGGGSGAAATPSASSPYSASQAREAKAILGDQTAYAEVTKLREVMRVFDGTGDLAGLMSAVTSAGGTAYDVARAYGYDLKQLEDVLKKEGIPAFAAGGIHTGGLRLVGERGPELEVTGPARYWSAGQTQQLLNGGNNSDGSALLQALQRVETALQDLARETGTAAKNTSGLPKVADAIERAAAGNGLRVKVIA